MDLASIGLSAVTGLTGGLVIGFALRRAISFLITVFGLFLMGLGALQVIGVAQVDYARLASLLQQLFVTGIETGSGILSSFGGAPFTAGLVTGGVLGLILPSGMKPASVTRRRRGLRGIDQDLEPEMRISMSVLWPEDDEPADAGSERRRG